MSDRGREALLARHLLERVGARARIDKVQLRRSELGDEELHARVRVPETEGSHACPGRLDEETLGKREWIGRLLGAKTPHGGSPERGGECVLCRLAADRD